MNHQNDNINSLPIDNTQQLPHEKNIVNTFFNQPQQQFQPQQNNNNVQQHVDYNNNNLKDSNVSKPPTIIKIDNSSKQTVLVMVIVIFLFMPNVDLFLMKKLPDQIVSNNYIYIVTKGVLAGILFWLLNRFLL